MTPVLLTNKDVTFTRTEQSAPDADGNSTDTEYTVTSPCHCWRTSPSPMLQASGVDYNWACNIDSDLVYPNTNKSIAELDRVELEDRPGNIVKGTIRSIHTSWGPGQGGFTVSVMYFKSEGS